MISEIQSAVNTVLGGRDLSADEMAAAVSAIMQGDAGDVAIAALLTALRMKGEAVSELVGAARAMRRHATPITCQCSGLLDTCGTGGDGLRTFNISTATALAAAAAGVPVAKHGNRSVSSSSGSADVLESLGVNIKLTPEQVAHCIKEVGIGFCFAPLVHGAMKYAAPVRKELGFRTIFNLLGPLTNPADAEFQLLGANRVEIARKLASALAELGRRRAVVVCGNDELDEVSLWGETAVFVVSEGRVVEETWTAESFHLATCRPQDLVVESSAQSAQVIREIFAGESGPARDIVLANTAAALIAAERAQTPAEGTLLAAKTIDSGSAAKLCKHLIAATNTD